MPSVRLTLHFVHSWLMILYLKQPQFPMRGLREGCTHRTSHSYLTSMVSTHHVKSLLTFSTPSLDVSVKLLSIVTLEFCLNTALLQSLQLWSSYYSTGLPQWDLLFGSCADSCVTAKESLPLVHPRQTPGSLYQKDFIRLKWCRKTNKTSTRGNGIHNPHSIWHQGRDGLCKA